MEGGERARERGRETRGKMINKHIRGGVRVSGDGLKRRYLEGANMQRAFFTIWRPFDAAALKELRLSWKRSKFIWSSERL